MIFLFVILRFHCIKVRSCIVDVRNSWIFEIRSLYRGSTVLSPLETPTKRFVEMLSQISYVR